MDYSQIPVKIIHLNTVDSTNNYIANLVQENTIQHGTVVLADYQTNGRGQRGTKWQSVSGENLISSLYLNWQNVNVAEQFRISMLVAIGICKYLRIFGKEAVIKWPNDILIDKRKICGILIENQTRGEHIISSIIGVGFNVNQTSFPDDVNGVGLAEFTEKKENIHIVALQLFQTIGEIINQYKDYPFEWIEKTYCAFLYGYDSFVKVYDNMSETELEIKILGVLPSGLLRVETNYGTKRLIDLKEIKFVII